MGQLRKKQFGENNAGQWQKYVVWVVFSVLIVLSLQANIELIQTENNNSRILNILRKINNSYARIEMYDLLALITLPLAYKYLEDKGNKRDWRTIALAAVFAVLFGICASFRNLNSAAFFNANTYQVFFSLLCLIGWFLLFHLLLRLLILFCESGTNGTPPCERSVRRFFLYSSCGIFLCWLPWILGNYPCIFYTDAQLQLAQALGETQITAHHPPLNTFIMGALFKLGELILDGGFGCFLYVLLQTVLGAIIFPFCIKRVYAAGLDRRICICAVAFFALAPLWGSFARWYEKDLLYAEMAALNLTFASDVIKSRSCNIKEAILLAVSALLMSLTRNNGIYEVFLLMLAMAVYVRMQDRSRIIAAFCGFIVVFLAITKLLYPSLGIENGSIKEMLSVPFQQTAKYVRLYESELTPAEREAIDGVIDCDTIGKTYQSTLADPVKNTYKGDASKLPTYFQTWFKMFFKHPGVYIDAFIETNVGYLAPIVKNTSPGAFTNLKIPLFLEQRGVAGQAMPKLVEIFSSIEFLQQGVPLLGYSAMPGFYVWLLLGCAVALLSHRKRVPLMLFIPSLINFLVCLASPMSGEMRYLLPLVANTPVLVCWTCYYTRNDTAAVLEKA